MTTDEIMALADEYSDAHLQMVTQGGLDPLVFRDSLQSAIEALQADAARYRWLRESRDDGFWKCHEKDGEGGSILKYGVDLDSAIDAAMGIDKP